MNENIDYFLNLSDPNNLNAKKQIEVNYQTAEMHGINDTVNYPSAAVWKRREQALLNCLPEITEKMQKQFKLDEGTAIKYYLKFCTSMESKVFSEEDIDGKYNISYAAALWILDMLKSNGETDYLDTIDYQEGKSSISIDFNDSMHSKKQVAYVASLLKSNLMHSKKGSSFYNSINAEYGKTGISCTNEARDILLRIFDNIKKSDIDKAVRKLEDAVIEVMKSGFKCLISLKKYVMNNNNDQVPIEELNALTNEYTFDMLSFLLADNFQNMLILDEDQRSLYGNKTNDNYDKFLSSFRISDPYAVCFAIFYLMLKGDDWFWLYTPVMTILHRCGEQLPWYYDVAKMKNKPFYISEYEMLSKKIYHITEMLIPRNYDNLDENIKKLMDLNYPKVEARCYAPLIMLATQYVKYISEQSNKLDSIKPKEKEIIKEVIDEKRVTALEAEINDYQKKLKEQRHINRKLQKQIQVMEEKNSTDRMELITLRENQYKTTKDNTVVPSQGEPVSFPYHTSRNIVCIGGSDKWHNTMQKLLPDVVLSKPDVKTNIDPFKNADEIWLQKEGLLHSESMPVTELAKRRNIPVMTFQRNGAKECAKEFARHDMKL